MISIIVPVYQSEATLGRCVESLTAQTYREIEILLVLDGASDGSGDLADALAAEDGRIRVLRQENQGVSAARNRGLDEALGDYVLFLDSDDYAEPRLCETLWLAIAEHNADLALCGFHHLYFGRDVLRLPREGVYTVRAQREELLNLYRAKFLNMPWNKLYRREMLHARFPADTDLGEDLLFNLAYLERCSRVAVVAQPLVWYVQDGGGGTLSTRYRAERPEQLYRLYLALREFCGRVYGSEESGGLLESRLTEALLDTMEELAFTRGVSGREKHRLIRSALAVYRRLPYQNDIRVTLLDYRILLPVWTGGHIRLTRMLIALRGMAVRIGRKRKGN